ncbi:hypothetical protein ACP4OV_023674 [Aristida adscensionis]
MERRGHCHGAHPPPLPPPRRARAERRQSSAGSFSASLLDAVYRSLDEGGDGADAVVDAPRWSEEKAVAPQFWWAKEGAKPRQGGGAERDRRRRETGPAARPRHSGYASSTASSSDSSVSYSSFSCSSASTTDTESTATRRRHGPPPPRPSEGVIAAAADEDEDEDEVAAPRNSRGKKKARPCFPGARLRPRNPPQSSPAVPPPAPPSPATFACVLKALFSSARLQRKPKTPAAATPPPVSSPPLQPPRTSVTCAAKADAAPEAPERRTVSFGPDAEASVVRRRVEELVRTLEELDEDDEGSDCSSDLFELENLRGAGAGDELPVYGTTSLAANRAIAQGTAC